MQVLSSDSFTDAPWYLALCRPNQNHIALRNLAKAGFDTFMPRHRASWRWREQHVDGWRPVFGGYLFFSMDPATPRWREIRSMPGIGSLVTSGPHSLVPVPPAVVTGLMLRCDAEGCLLPEPNFRVGEKLRLTCGPFEGFVGTVEKFDQERRIHMLLNMLGRHASLNVSHMIVERPI